jgi:hypothetical protein
MMIITTFTTRKQNSNPIGGTWQEESSLWTTSALNIQYFFLTDQVEKGNVKTSYCPTGEKIAACFSKTLQGKTFTYLK